MLTLPPSVRIFVALDPVDMRKSHHALAGVVQQLGLDPLSGHLVFFTNKRRNLAKIYFFDRTGQAILFKRLSRGRFQLPEVPDGTHRVEVDPALLTMMLEGIELRGLVRRARYRRPPPTPTHP